MSGGLPVANLPAARPAPVLRESLEAVEPDETRAGTLEMRRPPAQRAALEHAELEVQRIVAAEPVERDREEIGAIDDGRRLSDALRRESCLPISR